MTHLVLGTRSRSSTVLTSQMNFTSSSAISGQVAARPMTKAGRRLPRDVALSRSHRTHSSVGPRESEHMLGHIVEDHLPRYRSDELQAGEKPVVGKLILTRNTISTMGLDGPVEAENSRLGGRQFGDVAGFPGVESGVIETSGALHHELGEVELDLALGQGVGDRLV